MGPSRRATLPLLTCFWPSCLLPVFRDFQYVSQAFFKLVNPGYHLAMKIENIPLPVSQVGLQAYTTTPSHSAVYFENISMCVCVCMHVTTPVEIRGQLCEACSVIPPLCFFLGLNSNLLIGPYLLGQSHGAHSETQKLQRLHQQRTKCLLWGPYRKFAA